MFDTNEMKVELKKEDAIILKKNLSCDDGGRTSAITKWLMNLDIF